MVCKSFLVISDYVGSIEWVEDGLEQYLVNTRERERCIKFPLAPMGVLDPHVRMRANLVNRPTIDTSGISATVSLNISPTP